MITFKNRYAEFDNLDDSYNQNVFRNCYHREYRKNFFNFNKYNRNQNSRYGHKQNFNDMRLSNNNFNSYQRQNSSFTPFPQLPLINSNNYNNINNNEQYQQQNRLGSRSYPNMPSIMNYNNNNYIRTPVPRYNNPNNESGFISNNYDGNLSDDNIQFFNENNNLNVSNDSQYQEQNQNILNTSNEISLRQSLDNELNDFEKERKLLLEQEKLNQIDFELRYLRQKRKADLERRLAEQQQNLKYINQLKENELENNIYNNNQSINTRRINNYRINTFRNNNRAFNNNNNKILEESLKSSVMNDKFYMNELIQEINKMKISQQEANFEFQKKMQDLVKQNESIKLENQKMIEKIKDMKNALSEKKQNDDDIYNNPNNYDYLIEQRERRTNRLRQKKLFDDNNYDNNIKNNYDDNFENNSKSFNYKNENKQNNFTSLNLDEIPPNRKFYLGKKDNDVEEFNLLNKNLVNNNNVVVTPLLFDENKKYTKNYDIYTPIDSSEEGINFDGEYNKHKNYTIGNDYSDTRKENLYSLIRKNNDRLERIKEIEEKN